MACRDLVACTDATPPTRWPVESPCGDAAACSDPLAWQCSGMLRHHNARNDRTACGDRMADGRSPQGPQSLRPVPCSITGLQSIPCACVCRTLHLPPDRLMNRPWAVCMTAALIARLAPASNLSDPSVAANPGSNARRIALGTTCKKHSKWHRTRLLDLVVQMVLGSCLICCAPSGIAHMHYGARSGGALQKRAQGLRGVPQEAMAGLPRRSSGPIFRIPLQASRKRSASACTYLLSTPSAAGMRRVRSVPCAKWGGASARRQRPNAYSTGNRKKWVQHSAGRAFPVERTPVGRACATRQATPDNSVVDRQLSPAKVNRKSLENPEYARRPKGYGAKEGTRSPRGRCGGPESTRGRVGADVGGGSEVGCVDFGWFGGRPKG